MIFIRNKNGIIKISKFKVKFVYISSSFISNAILWRQWPLDRDLQISTHEISGEFKWVTAESTLNSVEW